MIAENILTAAASLVSGDRQADYGAPETNFSRIAVAWSRRFGRLFLPSEVAYAMADLKEARLVNSPGHVDSQADLLGYRALAFQLEGWEREGGFEQFLRSYASDLVPRSTSGVFPRRTP